MPIRIAPSILAADFLHLDKEIEMLNTYADIIHLDVMDGTFVSNISFGFSVLEPVSKIARIPMDAHLMIVHPEKYIERIAALGIQMISVHLESIRQQGDDPSEMLKYIRSLGCQAGLAFNPDVPVEESYPYLKDCDYVLAMSVRAGFGGQNIDPNIYSRVKTLKAEIERQGLTTPVEIDGGVTILNAAELADAGVDIFVAGSTVFKATDPASVIAFLRGAGRVPLQEYNSAL